MKHPTKKSIQKGKYALGLLTLASSLFMSQSALSAPGDVVHAYFADEHNTTPTTPTGNRILEIDIENMTLVNALDVPGILGHHADNGFNSKIYGVPKGSGFVNVIELRKDQNDTTSMQYSKKIDLTHMPRSGDAYNKKFNVILMVARNRPMGTFINVDTDEIMGTIGENVDCTLTDGTQLLSHADANTIAGATKYQCARASGSHGGDQISGHPYWLTTDYAAIIDRTNNQISVYNVWHDGTQLKSRLVNHLKTNTSIHQIVPRDRTALPGSQQSDFYAIEEGEHVGNMNPATGRGVTDADYLTGKPHALLHMKLTTNGLELVKRLNLQRTIPLSKVKSDRIIDACVANYRGQNRGGLSRAARYEEIFTTEGLARNPDQDPGADFPTECFYPGIPGGHNADFAPNNRHLYIGMAGGALSIVDVNRWKIVNNLDIGIRSGPGHTCFSAKHNLALTTNHGVGYTRVIRNINSNRPTISQYLPLGFTPAGLISTKQSHTCYIDEKEEFYYNFYTDGGVFYKMDLAAIAANTRNGQPGMVTQSLVTGGIPIQGSYIALKNIKLNTPTVRFAANNDIAVSTGSAVIIDVLANDTGVGLTLEHADGAYNGQVAIVNGKARYTPNQGFTGIDGFWYGISSPGLQWKWAFVSVTVNSTAPVTLKANDDTAAAHSGIAATIDVMANDTGSALSFGWVDETYSGTITKSNNKLIYTPHSNFTGTDEFWYELLNAAGESSVAKVTVTVTENSANVLAKNDAVQVTKGQTITIDALANDSGNNLTLFDTSDVWTGSFTVSNNKIVYQASSTITDSVEIWYGIKDPAGNESWAKVAISIVDGPVTATANDDAAQVKRGDTITIDVLANDSGNSLTLFDTSDVWTGSFTVVNNKIVYVASGVATDSAEIWYGIKDSAGAESWAKLTINVTN